MRAIQTVTVYAASSSSIHPEYFERARKLGAVSILWEERFVLSFIFSTWLSRSDDFLVCLVFVLGKLIAKEGWVQVNGGGKTGLMGAATEGGIQAGGIVDAVILDLFTSSNMHTLFRNVTVAESMPERKKGLFERGDAFIALPGGKLPTYYCTCGVDFLLQTTVDFTTPLLVVGLSHIQSDAYLGPFPSSAWKTPHHVFITHFVIHMTSSTKSQSFENPPNFQFAVPIEQYVWILQDDRKKDGGEKSCRLHSSD